VTIQPVISKAAPVLNTSVLEATVPEPFTDIRLHWLSPLLKMPGNVGIGGDLPRYNPGTQAVYSKSWMGVNSRISVE
jgi:hypothetical protein